MRSYTLLSNISHDNVDKKHSFIWILLTSNTHNLEGTSYRFIHSTRSLNISSTEIYSPLYLPPVGIRRREAFWFWSWHRYMLSYCSSEMFFKREMSAYVASSMWMLMDESTASSSCPACVATRHSCSHSMGGWT